VKCERDVDLVYLVPVAKVGILSLRGVCDEAISASQVRIHGAEIAALPSVARNDDHFATGTNSSDAEDGVPPEENTLFFGIISQQADFPAA